MPLPNHGEATYPGIVAYERFEFCDCSGTQPAIGTMTVFPQYGIPAQDGDVVLTYNGNTITLKDLHIDSVRYEVGGGGQIVEVRFLDSRWKWAHRSISGRYNFRLPDNRIDPAHEKTPQELATLCFHALGESLFDVTELPNDARLDVDWNHANPAQELDHLCHILGCRIVPVRSLGGWRIVVTGAGDDLPDFPAEDVGQGIDPQEIPDYIKIVTAPIRYQMKLPLRAIGKELDLSWKRLNELSYAPFPNLPSGGFGANDWREFRQIDSQRVFLADGTSVSPQELARDTVFHCYRVDFNNQPGCTQNSQGEWGLTVPTWTSPVTRRQIMLSNSLVQTWTDPFGASHQRPAFLCGVFAGELTEGPLANHDDGTRIERQTMDSTTMADERASFSLSLDPLDTDRSIISISPKMVKQIAPLSGIAGLVPYVLEWQEADLQLMSAFQIRHPQTWQPQRYEFVLQIGEGTDESFAQTVIKDEIQPVVVANYQGRTLTGYSTNYNEVQSQCRTLAIAMARKYATVNSQHRTYIGLYPLDLDGAICQVTYSISKQGASTIASQGTEHSWYTPDHEQRRQQVARQGIAEKLDFVKYEMVRRTAFSGSINT